MKRTLIFLSVSLITSFILTSCLKPKKFEPQNLSATTDMALGENVFSDAYKHVGAAGQAAQDSLGKAYNEMMAGCGSVTITPFDTVSWPKTVTVDFGTTNCMGSDFVNRRGKIICEFTYWFRAPGTVVTVNFDNYFVNDHQVIGTETITNNGRNNSNNLTYGLVFNNCQIIKPNNGGTILWNTTRTYEWLQGEGSWNPFDDLWKFNGTADGVSANGVAYNFTVIQDLYVQYGCRWVKQGKLNLNIQDVPTITVDFGNGNCDPNAVATFLGTDYPFVMQ